MMKDSKAYKKYQAVGSIYKFPGEFLMLGIIAILIDMMITHPIVTPEMTIIGVMLFILEAYFLFKRYILRK